MHQPEQDPDGTKKQPLKVCIDLSTEADHRLFGVFNAFKARKKNVLNENLKEQVGYDTLTEQALLDARSTNDFERLLMAGPEVKDQLLELAVMKSTFWTNGQTIRVRFLEGEKFIQAKVIRYAKEWEQFANITFDFVASGDAEIRISFTPGGSWSYLGTEALNYAQDVATMNFGWFDAGTDELEFSRTITHEFGHALGCVHEHQSPAAAIDWDKQAVYAYYMQPPNNWTKEQIDHNLFDKIDQAEITNSTYDPLSIMLYPIPKEFLKSGDPVGMNTFLSRQDALFIESVYPK